MGKEWIGVGNSAVIHRLSTAPDQAMASIFCWFHTLNNISTGSTNASIVKYYLLVSIFCAKPTIREEKNEIRIR